MLGRDMAARRYHLTVAVKDLLLPRTDAAVAVQAVIAATVMVAAFVVVCRDPDLRIFVVGLAVLIAAWFGLRALH